MDIDTLIKHRIISGEINTPCYVFRKDELTDGINEMKQAIKAFWPDTRAGYSLKTNSLPYYLLVLREAGFSAEVVSGDEYRLASYLGFTDIIYNGPVKEKTTFMEALAKGHTINLDAARELDWLKEWLDTTGDREFPAPVIGLRVNSDMESLCPGETSAGSEGSRFGFSLETGGFEAALKRLHSMGVELSGLHLHLSSKTRSVGVYKALAARAADIIEKFDLNIKYIDIGGGFFGGMKDRPGFSEYLEAISSQLLSRGISPEQTSLIIEPGTSLASRSFDYYTQVVDVRRTYADTIVTVDGSREDIDPLHTKSSYLYDIFSGEMTDVPASGEEVSTSHNSQTICGYTCMEGDRLFTLNCEEKILSPGDIIHISKAGGYTMCLTPLFIRYFPDIYYIDDKGTCHRIRRHWGPEDYCSGTNW